MTVVPAISSIKSRAMGSRAIRWAVRAAWIYLAFLVVVTILMRTAADRWWLATLLLYCPRWLFAVPVMVLIPAAFRWKGLVALLAAVGVYLFPFAGLCLTWPSFAADHGTVTVRVMTCNTDGGQFDAAALARLVNETKPDVVALQEWAIDSRIAVFGDEQWYYQEDAHFGMFSRFPFQRIAVLPWDALGGIGGGAANYEVMTPHGSLQFFNVHLPTPRDGIQEVVDRGWGGRHAVEENTEQRWQGVRIVADWISPASAPVIIAGDFNMPVESGIFREYWSGYLNAFSTAGVGFGHTKFSHWHGVRIDHILADHGWRCRQCWVGPDVRSDHRPVIADLNWVGAVE